MTRTYKPMDTALPRRATDHRRLRRRQNVSSAGMILRPDSWTPDGWHYDDEEMGPSHERACATRPQGGERRGDPLRVLIGCETSGVMRRAFARLGHDAWSCDLLPAEDSGNPAYPGRRARSPRGWLGSAGGLPPPCTASATAACDGCTPRRPVARCLTYGPSWTRAPTFRGLLAGAGGSCRHRKSGDAPPRPRAPAGGSSKPQIVQPWWFGEPFFKATGFTLRALPPCRRPIASTPPAPGTDDHKRWSAVHRASPGPDRWRFCSRTFEGVVAACADQWGGWVEEQEGIGNGS